MNLFSLRPFAFYAVRFLVAFLFITRSTLWFFIGFLYRSALGVVIPCLPASDMRYAVGSEVDFQPRFDKFYTRSITQRILHVSADFFMLVGSGAALVV